MKKFISILFCLAVILQLSAQERSVNIAGTNTLIDATVIKNIAYNGGTSDRLIPTTRDTIDYYVILSKWEPGPQHWYANFTLDTIAGADTTISITVLGKQMNSQSWSTLKAAVTSSAVSAELQVSNTSIGSINSVDTTGLKYYTSFKPSLLVSYKYLLFRLIIKGNDLTGTGIKVKRVELNFH